MFRSAGVTLLAFTFTLRGAAEPLSYHVIARTSAPPERQSAYSKAATEHFSGFGDNFRISQYISKQKAEMTTVVNTAKEKFPLGHTYTLVNDDIVLDEAEFHTVVNFLVDAKKKGKIKQKFVVVGVRYNGLISDFEAGGYQYALNHSERFWNNAQDYFITSREYSWDVHSGIITGKMGNDNYLVDSAFHDPHVSLIDASDFLRPLHLYKDKKGGHKEREKDAYVNHRVARQKTGGRNPFDHGDNGNAPLVLRHQNNGGGLCIAERKTSATVYCSHSSEGKKTKLLRVVSYSLYGGANPRYTDGATANANLVQSVYPGWEMWVYHDRSVPAKVLDDLRSRDYVKLINMDGSEIKNQRAWRFLVASDPAVERYAIRDIDSRLSAREKLAVDEWAESGLKFHIMRDHPSHAGFAMNAGMWGGMGGTIPDIESRLVRRKFNSGFFDDQNFLTDEIWPIASLSVMQHDSFSCKKFSGGRPFPAQRIGWEHVGSVFIHGKMRQDDVGVLKRAGVVKDCVQRVDKHPTAALRTCFPRSFGPEPSRKGQIDDSTTFAAALTALAKRPDVRRIFEIGTWYGGGSTQAFVNGLKNKAHCVSNATHHCCDAFLTTFEIFEPAWNHARFYHQNNPVWLVQGTTVGVEQMLRPDQIPSGEKGEHYRLYYERDRKIMERNSPQLEKFCRQLSPDVVLIDGNEYTGWGEFKITIGTCRPSYIALHDTGTLKTFKVEKFIEENPTKFELVAKGQDGAGWAIHKVAQRRRRQLQSFSPDAFKIIILTQRRHASLQRLLTSVGASHYGNHAVHLEIRVDYDDSLDHEKTIELARMFEFTHGTKAVYTHDTVQGLQRAWFGAWTPASESERAVILEDDMELSPLWFTWLQRAWDNYGERDDLGGISLCRQRLRASDGMSIMKQHDAPFLYRVVGSFGFSPNARYWKPFVAWAKTPAAQTADLSVAGTITSQWYKSMNPGSAWTFHWIWWCWHQRTLHTLYVHSPNGALITHWAEPGVHSRTKSAPNDRLLKATEPVLEAFPPTLTQFGWDFELEDSEKMPKKNRNKQLVARQTFHNDSSHIYDAYRTHMDAKIESLPRYGTPCAKHPAYVGEFGYELQGIVPWYYDEHITKKCDLSVTGVPGARYLYWFASSFDVIPKARRSYAPLPDSGPLKHDTPHVRSLPLSGWTMPPWREFFGQALDTSALLHSDKPIAMIFNKYTTEWNKNPVNFLDIKTLRALITLLTPSYKIVYVRMQSPALQDQQKHLNLGEIEMIRNEHPSVAIFQDMFNKHTMDYNLLLFGISAKTSLFISVQGGNSVVASLWAAPNMIYAVKGNELKVNAYEGYYGQFGGSEVWSTDDRDKLVLHIQQYLNWKHRTEYITTIWSNDFHISTIANIKNLLRGSAHFIDKSLSGHCHLTKTCATELKVLTQQNGISPSPAVRRAFADAYRNDPEFATVDIVMCFHPSAMCELFMPLNKRLFVIATTRYEMGRHSKDEWQAWNKNLKRIAADPKNVVAANNLYDAKYIEYFTGIKPVVWPSVVRLRDVYQPISTDILVPDMHSPGSGKVWNVLRGLSSNFVPLRTKYGHYTHKQLCENTAILHLPYQVSIMSLFEQYGMGIPIIVPSLGFLWELHDKYDLVTERTWERIRSSRRPTGSVLPGIQLGVPDPNNDRDKDAFLYWVRFADFYQWPHILTFDSWDDLLNLTQTVNWTSVSKKMRKNFKLKFSHTRKDILRQL